jgi:hypothetical protein
MRMTFHVMAMTVIYRNRLIVSLVKLTSLFVTNAFVILTGAAFFRLHTKENFFSVVVIVFFIFNLSE